MNRENSITSILATPLSNGLLNVAACGKNICTASNGNSRTPMSTLTPTPMIPFTASLASHSTLLWLYRPVAIAGHIVRPLSFGAGFFKLQLQYVVGLLPLLLLVSYWSCNLKKIFHGLAHVFTLKNPDDDVAFASSLATSTHTAAHRCCLPSSRKCWILSADSTL